MTPTDPLRPPLDPDTLQEVQVDVPAVTARLHDLDDRDDEVGLAERAVALRLLGRLGEAEDSGRRAVAAGQPAGAAAAARARTALGSVLAAHGRFDEAEAEFAAALADAAQAHDEDARAEALEQRGRSRFDQGRVAEAERDFTAALQLRRLAHHPGDQVARVETAVAAAVRRLIAAGHTR